MALVKETDALQRNYQKLEYLRKLKENWNDNFADPFSENLINRVEKIISLLDIQPDIFPTSRNSIQLEYERKNGDYLEFEIFDHTISCFQDKDGEELDQSIEIDEIPALVLEFYARR